MNISPTILSEGARRFDLDPNHLRYLGGVDGAVYLGIRDGQGYALKFEPAGPEKIAPIMEKFAFIDYLVQHGVSIPKTFPSVGGSLVEIVTEGETTCAVTKSQMAPGSNPTTRSPLWTPELIRGWGELTGRMHRLTQEYPVWRRPSAPGDPPTAIMDWRMEMESMANWCSEDDVRRVWLGIRDELEALPIERDGFGLIHNDVHPWNLLYDGRSLTIIDFDVCCYHWFLTDIGIALFQGILQKQTDHAPKPYAFAELFLSGYLSENNLSRDWLKHLPVFLRYRQTLLCIVFTNVWTTREPWQKAMLDDLHKRVRADRPIIDLGF